MKNSLITSLPLALASFGAAILMSAGPAAFPAQQGQQQQAQSSTQNAPKVTVGNNLKSKAAAPSPSSSATNQTHKSTIGKGAASAKVAQPSSFWTETIDIDNSGNSVATDFLYDAPKGVLYAYRQGNFTCPNGNPDSGDILTAVFTQGNKMGKPPGSGWYLVDLNAGQCKAREAGTYGCKFDANGNPTVCGAATVDYATGDIDVVVAQ